MAAPATPPSPEHCDVLTASPEEIRRCLSPALVAEFDREWEIVMDRAKQAKTLEPVHSMLTKWRHIAHAEQQDPGAYYRLLATEERTLHTGQAPVGSASGDDIKAMIRQRLERQS